MSSKMWVKKTMDGKKLKPLKYAVIDILQKYGNSSQAKIQKFFESSEYKIVEEKTNKETTISRMGLWEVLDKLEKQGEIEKIVLDGKIGFAVTNKSKILAEVQGKFFRAHFKKNMMINEINSLKEFKKNDSTLDPMLKFLGFYVLGSLFTSDHLDPKHSTNKNLNKKEKEELRNIWLSAVLNLQKGEPISNFYDEYFKHNKKDVTTAIKQMSKAYPLNMNLYRIVLEHIQDSYPKIKSLSDDTFDKSVIELKK